MCEQRFFSIYVVTHARSALFRLTQSSGPNNEIDMTLSLIAEY